MKKEKIVNSELLVKATAAVEESAKKDLEVADPTKEQAKAILDENTTGNDRKRSAKGDRKDSQ